MMAEIIKADAAAASDANAKSEGIVSKKNFGLLTAVERHQLLSSVCMLLTNDHLTDHHLEKRKVHGKFLMQ